MQVSIAAGGTKPVDTVQIYLEFDPTALQVEAISAGPRLEYLLLSDWTNKRGLMAYAAGTLGPAVESTFILCTITFRGAAQARHTGTRIRFADSNNVHHTKVISRGRNVTGQLSPLEVIFR